MKTVENAVPENVKEELAALIGTRLEKNEPTLLLCTGGLDAQIAVAVCTTLINRLGDDAGRIKWLLTVSLACERFGAEGHADSNWAQLVELGLPVKKIGTIKILQGSDADEIAFEKTVRHYDDFLAEAAEKKRNGTIFIAGLFSIGDDDRIAGILPDSPVVTPQARGKHDLTSFQYAAGYRSSILTRLTVTPAFFPFFDHISVWIDRTSTPDAAANLEKELSPVDHPSQLLKKAGETVLFVS